MKMAMAPMWLSESEGGVVGLPSAGPQSAASAASSSQTLRSVLTTFDSWHVIAIPTVADGGARRGSARTLRRPSRRRLSGTFGVIARERSAISGCSTPLIRYEAAVASHNNALEPTPVTKARFVWFGSGAAQRKRSA